jgi:NADH:ubiquinone reductase (H+-translocating)
MSLSSTGNGRPFSRGTKLGAQQRVVIIGAGFGGLYAAQALKHAPVSVTVIDRRNFHLFQPLLYQVATGSLSPGEIAAPIRSVLADQRNTEVLLGDVTHIDLAHRKVSLSDGAEIPYDLLIVATGSRSTYFGKDEWRQVAPSLKTIEEATAIRHKILFAFEAAEREPDPEERKAWLRFVIVGGGLTGVELAGALGEIARYTLKHEFRAIRPEEAQIFLLEGSPRIMSAYPPDLADTAVHSLNKLGVNVKTDVRVTNVTDQQVTYHSVSGERSMRTRTVLWTAGVTSSELTKSLAEQSGAELDKLSRLKVNRDLTLPGHPEVFIVGDIAEIATVDGKVLPGVAQVAIQGGAYAAKTILGRINGKPVTKPFHYVDKGNLAVIGRGSAVADIGGIHLSGFIAWLIWLFVHVLYLIEFRSRLLVMIQWGFQYLTFGRGARLITGPIQLPSRAKEPAQGD